MTDIQNLTSCFSLLTKNKKPTIGANIRKQLNVRFNLQSSDIMC